MAISSQVLVINKPKKILIINHTYPPELGGKAAYVRLLKEELPKISQDKIRVITLSYQEIKNWPQIFRPWWLAFQLLTRGRHCDLILTLDPATGWLVGPLARWLKKPLWTKIFGEDWWRAQTDKREPLVQLLRAVNLVLVAGPVSKAQCLELLPELSAPIAILPTAYTEPLDLPERETLRLKLKVTGQIVLASGRLSARKNFVTLCRQWPSVLADFPEAKLLIVGAGETKTLLEQTITELNLAESVMLTPTVPTEMLLTYLRLADVYVLPSLYESDSQALLEARALGTPLVVADTGDVSTVTTGARVTLYSPHDPQALGTALKQQLSRFKPHGLLPPTKRELDHMLTNFIQLILEATRTRTSI